MSTATQSPSIDVFKGLDRRLEIRRQQDYDMLYRARGSHRTWLWISVGALLAGTFAARGQWVLGRGGVHLRPDMAVYTWSGFHRIALNN